ncbi:MAG: VOC family protein [Bacteroidota bacterium]|nr:VOC family protein [Bacteroidota bacterium]MDX5448423.1 VOC family protein [Bacteroidota bacterium]MDX5504891.1 VOC family protein [Bacteroidota bacterium]
MKQNMINWFEIPVTDMDRAIEFYQTILGIEITRAEMGPLDMGWFPGDPELPGASGSLVKHPDFYFPSNSKGTLIYFNSPSGDLSNELSKVEAAGGKVLQEKKQIAPDVGFMGLFIDSEGNRIALHSQA